MNGSVEHCVGVSLAQLGVGLVAVGVAGVANAAAHAETVQHAVVPGVVGPQRSLLIRHQLQAVAFESAILHFGLGQGVGRDHLEVFGHVGNGFQLQALDLHFTGLAGDIDAGRIGRGDRNVFLGQVVDRRAQQGIAARWLVLDAQFPLFAFSRLERIGRRCGGVAGWLERFGVRQVRHDAVVEHVADRRVAAEVGIAFGVGGIALVEELGAGVDPVFAAAQGQAPLVEGQLILDVEAGLIGLLVVVIKRVGAWWTHDRLAINRVVDVGGQAIAEDRGVVGVAALVIEAEQQGVLDIAGGEVGLEVVIHGELADVLVGRGTGSAHVAVGIDLSERIGADGERLEGQVRLGVAQVLAELPDIVQTMFKGVTQCVVGAVVVFPVRVAQVFVVGNIAER
ncbi:hypothetical protein D3C73_816400 [compost metagenome]